LTRTAENGTKARASAWQRYVLTISAAIENFSL
jgi:hypothetical protein